jgi:uncharacterized protein DUF3253
MPDDVTDRLETSLLELLERRAPGATVCPSEAARQVSGAPDDPDAWRPLMEPARDAVRRLVADGAVEVTQRGEVVDLDDARGPIRVRRRDGRR